MPALPFTRNDSPTLGVELELQLVDARTFGLTSRIEQILAKLPEELALNVKPELLQCYLEINTGVCPNVGAVRRDLTRILKGLHKVTEPLGVRLLWAATHPFSSWRRQDVTVTERYYQLVELMPELEGVSAWHAVGQRRTLDEVGRVAERRMPDHLFAED